MLPKNQARRLRSALLITFAVAALSDASGKTPARSNGELVLTVIDEKTKALLPKATADNVLKRGRYNAKDGIITLPTTHDSFPFTIVQSPGYAPEVIAWLTNTRPPAQLKTTVKLKRGTTIGGTVIDESGHPAANVRVYIVASPGLSVPPPDAEDRFVRAPGYMSLDQPAITDSEGRWTCPDFPTNLDRGTVHIFLIPEQAARTAYHLDTSSTPATTTLWKQTTRMKLKPGVTIRGRVTTPDGTPISNATLLPDPTAGVKYLPQEPLQSNKDGSFVLHRPGPHRFVLKTRASGYSADFSLITPGSDAQITLHPEEPLRFRVIDESGKRVSDATVAAFLHGSVFPWEQTREQNGDIALKAPPAGKQIYIATTPEKQGFIEAEPGKTTQEIILDKSVPGPDRSLINIAVTTPDGKPAGEFQIFAVMPNKPEAPPQLLCSGKDGRFVGFIDFLPTWQWIIEGPDFHPEPVNAPGLELYTTYVVAPRKGLRLSGQLLCPDGSPAKNAEIIFARRRQPLPWHFSDTEASDKPPLTLRADPEGSYTLKEVPEERDVTVRHDSGYLKLPLTKFLSQPNHKLTAWSHLELSVIRHGQPAAGMQIAITPEAEDPRAVPESIPFTTDEKGMIILNNVPRGHYRLHSALDDRSLSPKQRILLTPGNKATVSVSASLYSITGRLTPPTPSARWQAESFADSVTSAGESPTRPDWIDYPYLPEFGAALRTFHELEKNWVSCSTAFYENGRFEISQLPPGNYVLKFTPRLLGSTEPELYTVEHPFSIPEKTDSAPIDLGEITPARLIKNDTTSE